MKPLSEKSAAPYDMIRALISFRALFFSRQLHSFAPLFRCGSSLVQFVCLFILLEAGKRKIFYQIGTIFSRRLTTRKRVHQEKKKKKKSTYEQNGNSDCHGNIENNNTQYQQSFSSIRPESSVSRANMADCTASRHPHRGDMLLRQDRANIFANQLSITVNHFWRPQTQR